MAYNSQGKRIRSENLAGQVTTTARDQFACTSVDELISAAKNAKSAKHAYDFDQIGNRKTSAERGVQSAEYMSNELNQYTNIEYSAVSPATCHLSPTYDADGNQTLIQTATGIWQITYNGENRPVRWELVSSNSNTPNSNTQTLLRMSFDRMGRRVTKNDQRFVYNGYLQICNYYSSTSTSHFNYYIWDPTEPVATRPLAWKRGTSVAYYTHDGNKNVSEVIASNNDVAAHYEYAPFGALTVSRGASAADNPWRFSSEYAEDDTATVYYNYRHYEPVTGRWMSRDPIGERGGALLCAFCVNNPISCFDRNGLSFAEDFQDSVRIVAGLAMLSVSAGIMAASSWTGVGLVAGAALAVFAADQMVLGGNNILSRRDIGSIPEDTSPIKTMYRSASRVVTGVENSGVEKFLDNTYTDIELVSSCYSGFVAARTSVVAYRSIKWIPPHSEWVVYGEKKAGTVTIRWGLQMVEGAWDKNGIIYFRSTVIEGAASFMDSEMAIQDKIHKIQGL